MGCGPRGSADYSGREMQGWDGEVPRLCDRVEVHALAARSERWNVFNEPGWKPSTDSHTLPHIWPDLRIDLVFKHIGVQHI